MKKKLLLPLKAKKLLLLKKLPLLKAKLLLKLLPLKLLLNNLRQHFTDGSAQPDYWQRIKKSSVEFSADDSFFLRCALCTNQKARVSMTS